MRNVSDGVEIKVVARASDEQDANDAAVFFVGQGLDVLTLGLNLPLHLSLFDYRHKKFTGHVKRIVTKEEWIDSFDHGRVYGAERQVFSRSLSWYRKSLTSEDPIDRLIALWSSLEGVCSVYHQKNETTKKGIVNQVYNCFDQLWGSSDKWKVIPGRSEVVKEFHEYRNGIAHGFFHLDIEKIREIVGRLLEYTSLTYSFLKDWEKKGFLIEVNSQQEDSG